MPFECDGFLLKLFVILDSTTLDFKLNDFITFILFVFACSLLIIVVSDLDRLNLSILLIIEISDLFLQFVLHLLVHVEFKEFSVLEGFVELFKEKVGSEIGPDENNRKVSDYDVRDD